MAGLSQQRRGDRQVVGGRGGVDMPQERRQSEEPLLRVDSLSIPMQQASDSEGVPEIM